MAGAPAPRPVPGPQALGATESGRARFYAIVPLILGIHVGLPLVVLAIKGELFSPNNRLHGVGSYWLGVFQIGVGIALIYGAMTRLAGAVLGVLWLMGAGVFGLEPMLENAHYLGFAAFFFLTGRGPYAIDRLLIPALEPLARLAKWAMPSLRIGLGLGLTVVAFTEKLANPELSKAFLAKYPLNFTAWLHMPMSDDIFVLCAGSTEPLIGLCLLFGFFPRTIILTAWVFINMTLTIFDWVELVGHLPLYGAMAVLLIWTPEEEDQGLWVQGASAPPRSQAMESDAGPDEQRIASLSSLMHGLRQCRTPAETLLTIRRGFWEAYGPVALMMLSTRGLAAGEYRVVELFLNTQVPDDYDPWTPQDHSPVNRGGPLATIIANSDPRIINGVDWTTDPVLGETLAGYSSVMAVPLDGDALPVNWIVYLRQGPDRFRTADLTDAIVRIRMIEALLESRILADDLARANEQIDRDMRQAGELQRSLLPEPLPQIAGLEIAASYRPSSRAGGDLYDFFPLDEEPGLPERWCVLIADASGHGLAAAMVMTMVQSILHAHPPRVSGPVDLLGYVNRQLCGRNIPGFVTAFLGLYEPGSRRLSYACAGHPPPLVKHSANGPASRLNAVASCPLGIDAAVTFAEATVYARPGDIVLLYTDGITEAWGPNRKMFTAERLEQEFLQCTKRPADLIEHVCELVRSHEQGRLPVDDQTVVAIAAI